MESEFWFAEEWFQTGEGEVFKLREEDLFLSRPGFGRFGGFAVLFVDGVESVDGDVAFFPRLGGDVVDHAEGFGVPTTSEKEVGGFGEAEDECAEGGEDDY